MHRASIIIQSAFCGYQCKLKYKQIRCSILNIQSYFRASLVRKQFLQVIKFFKSWNSRKILWAHE